jgi:very-short-patch-repair endonuclease
MLKEVEKTVLVGVLKSRNDLQAVLKDLWYRIPAAYLPKRKFKYLAFYQPAVFGKNGKQIQYYARIAKTKVVKRIDLIPKESKHPRAQNDYLKVELSWVKKLPKPIKNIIPRRVSFGFTSLKSLLDARNILELYGIAPTEQIMQIGLNRIGVETVKEFNVSKGRKRYRIDLVVFCKNGKIAIECDNLKAHNSEIQKNIDKLKDNFLMLNGWQVIRLKEENIITELDICLARVRKIVRKLGGQKKIF